MINEHEKTLIALTISIALVLISIYLFYFDLRYSNCGSACAPSNWLDGMLRLFYNPTCIEICVPGEYPTNLYLIFGWLGILGIIISIIFFVKRI